LLRARTLFVVLCLGLVSGLLARPSFATSSFSQAWSLAGWEYLASLGRPHGGSAPALLCFSRADHHFAIVDGLTGSVQQEFPDYAYGYSAYQLADVNGDGLPELFFYRQGAAPKATVYTWSGTAYVPLFPALADTVVSWLPAHVRSATTYDIVETTNNDLRVRDLTGALIYRAATAIPGWTGVSATVSLLDLEYDGTMELGIAEFTKSFHMIKYTGGAFTQLWSNSGWFLNGDFGVPGDTQPRLNMLNPTTHHNAMFNASTGAMVRDFTNYGSASLVPYDITGDGHPEIIGWRTTPTPLFQAFHWNGSSYDSLFTVTDKVDSWTPVHMRSAAQTELLESVTSSTPRDVRVRDTAGNVLFRASTAIPGWTGLTALDATPYDLDHNGLQELLISEDATVRLFNYSGTFAQAWVQPSGWARMGPIGSTDGEAADNIMMMNIADGSYNVVSGATGASLEQFHNFSTNHGGTYLSFDLDGDGRNELLFGTLNGSGAPPLMVEYKWGAGAYVSVFGCLDSLAELDVYRLRDNRLCELTEVSPSLNVVLRDPLSGSVLFNAATDLSGWAGVDPTAPAQIDTVDSNANGVQDLVLNESNQVRMIRFAGSAGVQSGTAPTAFRVFPSAPNPFRSSAALRFVLPRAGDVGVRIFDAAGRLVRHMDRAFPAGLNEIAWDGRDDAGRPVPSGILFYEVRSGGLRQTMKVVRTP